MAEHDDDLGRAGVDHEDRARPTRVFDPGTVVIGAWFLILGILAMVLGDDLLDDLPPIVVPISFAITGLALLLPKRTVPRRDDADW